MSAQIEGRTTYDGPEEDRRPLDVEVEMLSKQLAILDDHVHRLGDRLQPILSDRGVLTTAAERIGPDEVDARSSHVRTLGSLTQQVERLTERVDSLFQRVDC